MNRLLHAACFLAILGCAAIEPADEGDAQIKAEDALVATVVDDAGGPPPVAPPTGPPPPIVDAGDGMGGAPGAGGAGGAPEGCSPGDRLGVCSVCGEDGEPTAPATDANCPAVDCGEATSYQRTQEAPGVVVCTAQRPRIREGVQRCLAVGECQNDPLILCGDPTGEEVARTTSSCEEMLGCDGPAAPQVQPAPAGAQCNTFGTCQAGECSVSARCAGFAGPNTVRFCLEGRDGVNAFCEFYVDGPGGDYSCDDFCQSFGAVCLAAFSDDNDTCRHEGGNACNNRQDDQICRCVTE